MLQVEEYDIIVALSAGMLAYNVNERLKESPYAIPMGAPFYKQADENEGPLLCQAVVLYKR